MEDIIFRLAVSIPGFLLAIVFHEAAHAYVALRFGDPTAKLQGRLSLNPAVHWDLVGTIIMPIFFIVLGWGIFGYAKPVPVDPRNLKNVKWGIFWVSFAGPLANVALAIISAFALVVCALKVSPDFYLYDVLRKMLESSVYINIILAVFNLIPWPPLDGSKMVATFLDYNQARKYEELQRFSLLFFIILWQTNILSYVMSPAMMAANGVIHLFGALLS
ncbi:MAG: site-2 protease family protein [Bacteriovoracaceae bacterium]